MRKVRVIVEAAYIVEVDTHSDDLAVRGVRENWDTVYRHRARAEDFPPQLSPKSRVVRVEAAKD